MLRSACVDDLKTLLPLANDPDVRPWIFPLETELTLGTFVGAMTAAQQGTLTYPYVIIEAEALVGFLSLQNVHGIHRRGYLANMAVAKVKNRLHVAQQASRDLLQIAFRTLNLHRVECTVYSDNPRMRAVLWSVGAKHEGTARESVWHEGEMVGLELWAVLRPDWVIRHAG